MDLRIITKPEYDLTAKERSQIYELRKDAFPEHDVTNHYGKQLPTARVLVFENDHLVDHIALVLRMIRLNDKVFRTMGIQDVIVRESHRGQGIMNKMMSKTEKLAHNSECALLMLFTTEPEIYAHLGFHNVAVDVEWLKIHNGRHLGIGREKVEETMIKWLNEGEEAVGFIDMLGHIF